MRAQEILDAGVALTPNGRVSRHAILDSCRRKQSTRGLPQPPLARDPLPGGGSTLARGHGPQSLRSPRLSCRQPEPDEPHDDSQTRPCAGRTARKRRPGASPTCAKKNDSSELVLRVCHGRGYRRTHDYPLVCGQETATANAAPGVVQARGRGNRRPRSDGHVGRGIFSCRCGFPRAGCTQAYFKHGGCSA